MKTKKIFSTAVAVAVFCAMFSGCSEQRDGDIGSAQNGTENNCLEVSQAVEDNTELEINIPEEEIMITRLTHAPLWIEPDENGGFRDGFVRLINASQAVDRGERVSENVLRETARLFSNTECPVQIAETAQIAFSARKLSDLTSFYCFDDTDIEDFNLVQVGITQKTFLFIFTRNGELLSNDVDSIQITVSRLDCHETEMRQNNLFAEMVEQTINQDRGYLTENGMLFSYGGYGEEITAPLGHTVVSVWGIGTIEKSYEDLTLQVIETAELVNVERAIAELATE
jgi:hypothetical protein